nr:hypothetical protein [Saprospiraceae bacterium]
MDYKQIQDLIKLVNKNNIAELKLEQEGFKIVIRSIENDNGSTDAPQVVTMMTPPAAAMPAVMPSAPAPAAPTAPSVDVSAPSPSPEADVNA